MCSDSADCNLIAQAPLALVDEVCAIIASETSKTAEKSAEIAASGARVARRERALEKRVAAALEGDTEAAHARRAERALAKRLERAGIATGIT